MQKTTSVLYPVRRAVLGFVLAGLHAAFAGTAEPVLQGNVSAHAVRSAALGEDLHYLVYLPPAYGADTTSRFPVIYFLHGRGESMDSSRAILPNLEKLIATHLIPPVIAILPDVPYSQRASYYIDSQFENGKPVETAFVTDLIPHIDAMYRTIATRTSRIVAGYSMGGYGAIRYSLAHPELFAAAIVLSPAVYFPLPPTDSSTREFGAFGRGRVLFDDAIYQQKNYPALIPTFIAKGLSLIMFIASGDDEHPVPNPAEAMHDIDYEAHTLYNRVRRVPGITTELRIMNGSHNWSVWRPGFEEAAPYIFNRLNLPPAAAPKPP